MELNSRAVRSGVQLPPNCNRCFSTRRTAIPTTVGTDGVNRVINLFNPIPNDFGTTPAVRWVNRVIKTFKPA